MDPNGPIGTIALGIVLGVIANYAYAWLSRAEPTSSAGDGGDDGDSPTGGDTYVAGDGNTVVTGDRNHTHVGDQHVVVLGHPDFLEAESNRADPSEVATIALIALVTVIVIAAGFLAVVPRLPSVAVLLACTGGVVAFGTLRRTGGWGSMDRMTRIRFVGAMCVIAGAVLTLVLAPRAPQPHLGELRAVALASADEPLADKFEWLVGEYGLGASISVGAQAIGVGIAAVGSGLALWWLLQAGRRLVPLPEVGPLAEGPSGTGGLAAVLVGTALFAALGLGGAGALYRAVTEDEVSTTSSAAEARGPSLRTGQTDHYCMP